MRKLLTILFLLGALKSLAENPFATGHYVEPRKQIVIPRPIWSTTYYVSTTGSNGNNGLTAGTAWATLEYASTHASAPCTIWMLAGTYTLTAQVTLAEQTTLRGDGSRYTTIKSTYHNTNANDSEFTAQVVGISAMGTAGNQEIYGIKFDGHNSLGNYGPNGWGLQIQGRSSVGIHDCVFTGFLDRGCILAGRNDNASNTPPTTYATNCYFNNNRMDSCARFSGTSGTGAVNIGGLLDFQVNYDTITIKDRNGFPIKNYNDGFLYRGEFGYDSLEKAPLTAGNGSGNWDFCIELSSQSQIEIHHCKFRNGGIDFNRCIRNGYSYGTWIHDNTGLIVTKTGAGVESFITFDYAGEGITIENNVIKNYSCGVLVTNRNGDSLIDFTLRNNVMDSIYGSKILDLCQASVASYKARNIRIYNNYFRHDPSSIADYSFNWPMNTSSGSLDSFYFVGNDVRYVNYLVRQGGVTALNYFIFKNNNIRDSGGGIFSLVGPAITNLTNTGNYGLIATYDANKVITGPSTLLTGVTTSGYPFTPWTLVGYQGPDNTPPTVVSTNPVNGATGVYTNSTITITFDGTMDATTLNSTNIFVTGRSGTVTYGSNYAVITFSSDLAYSTIYTLNVQNVKDAAGNTIASPYTGTFTTISAPPSNIIHTFKRFH